MKNHIKVEEDFSFLYSLGKPQKSNSDHPCCVCMACCVKKKEMARGSLVPFVPLSFTQGLNCQHCSTRLFNGVGRGKRTTEGEEFAGLLCYPNTPTAALNLYF